MPKRPEGMSDEMWAAVQIIMEDENIKSYKELTESHKAVIQRMDEWETRISEREAEGEAVTEPPAVPPGPGDSVPAGEGGPTPPPLVERDGEGEKGEEGDGKKGSGRGGRPRWYERDGYA